jgi:two-component system response regulator HydG
MTQPARRKKPAPTSSVSVMLIDDEPEFVEKLRYMMESYGFECRAFSDPGEAMESLGDNYFDVIVTDYQMPGLNGTGVIEQVKKLSPDSKVIVVSGCLDGRTKREVIRVGASACLTKPLHISSLLSALNDVCQMGEASDGSGH